jgi:hypothetical protein
VGWDELVPASMESDFRSILQHLKDLKRVEFPRSIWPEPHRGPVKGTPCHSSLGMDQWRPVAPRLPEMGVGGWVSSMSASGRKDRGRPQVQDFHPQDGAYGG